MAQEQPALPWGEPSAPPARPGPLPSIRPLAGRLRELADRRVYLGTSSWKYPGWLNQVYHPDRYATRGKFSRKKFNEHCLSEYASIFPTVCGDFAFYQFPSERTWRQTFAQVPDGFRFSLKIPEEITVEQYPDLPRYGQRAGTVNAHFMDSTLLRDQLLAPLESYRGKLGVLIFQFGMFHQGPTSTPREFAAALDRLLSRLPTDHYRFAVEVRNPEYLDSPSTYLDTLRAHGVSHCLNSWTHMPGVDEQMRVPGIFTADHVVARFLLKPGRAYQQAVDRFSPYERVRDPYPEGRTALKELIVNYADRNAFYAFVNNRFEGNAVETIEQVLGAVG